MTLDNSPYSKTCVCEKVCLRKFQKVMISFYRFRFSLTQLGTKDSWPQHLLSPSLLPTTTNIAIISGNCDIAAAMWHSLTSRVRPSGLSLRRTRNLLTLARDHIPEEITR